MAGVPSRLNEARAAVAMVSGRKPVSVESLPTLVATRTSTSERCAANQRPMIRSDSPPLLPGAHSEYMSAVSMRRPPPAAKASNTANEVASSAVQPNTLPPRQR